MLKIFLVATLILGCSVQGSPISVDDAATKDQQSTPTLRDTISDRLLKYMNESVDPCESFYEFACGNWKTHHPATRRDRYTRSFLMPQKTFYGKVGELLATPPTETDTEAELKVKNFYQSCLGFTQLYSKDNKEKLPELMAEFGQMPALMGDEWQEEDFDWLKTVAEISHKYGINIILGYSIDSTTNSINLICGNDDLIRQGLTMPLNIWTSLMGFLGVEMTTAQGVADEIFMLATKVVLAGRDNNETISMDDLYTKYLPDLDVQQLFNISFGYLPTGFITEKCNVRKVIEAVNQTPKRVVANYIFYQLLKQFMVDYPENKTELAEKCLSETLTKFPHVVSFMFNRANDLTQEENYVERMWQDMKSTLQMMLETSQLRWFDDVTRKFALEKLHSMEMVVPLYKENHFDEEYGQLSVKKDDYFENVKSLRTLKAAKTRASLTRAPNHIDDNLDLDVPMYIYVTNSLVIPVSFLATDVSFSTQYPQAINFASLGFTMSHEAMHGFSAAGREYNSLGNYVGKWGTKVEKEYDERRQCLYDMYHNYTVDGKPLLQDESQAENFADIVGIVVAYDTYRRWYEDSARTEEELALETLPNLNYTSQQLFFITYAHGWCADSYDGNQFIDTHSPDMYRAFVPLTNIGEFSEAFECPKGSAMNPEKQCPIK